MFNISIPIERLISAYIAAMHMLVYSPMFIQTHAATVCIKYYEKKGTNSWVSRDVIYLIGGQF